MSVPLPTVGKFNAMDFVLLKDGSRVVDVVPQSMVGGYAASASGKSYTLIHIKALMEQGAQLDRINPKTIFVDRDQLEKGSTITPIDSYDESTKVPCVRDLILTRMCQTISLWGDPVQAISSRASQFSITPETEVVLNRNGYEIVADRGAVGQKGQVMQSMTGTRDKYLRVFSFGTYSRSSEACFYNAGNSSVSVISTDSGEIMFCPPGNEMCEAINLKTGNNYKVKQVTIERTIDLKTPSQNGRKKKK